MYVCKCLAAAQRPVLLPAAPHRLLPQAFDPRGRTPLLSPRRPRGPGGQKHPGGTEFAAGGPCDEERVMHGKISCGGQMETRRPHMEIELRKFTGMRCLTNKGQARQGFDTCRAVSLYEGYGEKADAGFVDAQGSILSGRIFVTFGTKLMLQKAEK